jgi:endonuclease/exonuclease/phosphatase family metal-dependent hydrolase
LAFRDNPCKLHHSTIAFRGTMNVIKMIFSIGLLVSIDCVDFFRTQFDDVEEATAYQAALIHSAPQMPETLKVMMWNIRYGAARIPLFYEGWGDRYNMSKSEVISNLSKIEKKITEVDPDVIFLQELDIDSKRTAYVDQLQHILDNTNLNYAFFASIWKADLVPSDGLGRINMGNAIASKWPLFDGTRIALPRSTDQTALEKYFWFARNILKAKIVTEKGLTINLLTIHTDAWTTDGTKKKQIDQFKEALDAINEKGEILIGGGDFNELTPGSPRWKDFKDLGPKHRFKEDDYTGEEQWMSELYAAYTPAIPLSVFQDDPSRYYTFTGDGNSFWNRTLDHLFTNASFRCGVVLQDTILLDATTGIPTMPLSDHAPTVACVEVKQ